MDVDFGDPPAEETQQLAPVVPMQRRLRAPKEESRDYLANPIEVNAAVGRSMPHSMEAEEYLLSCCMLDGPDVLPRAEEAGIRERSFYLDAHGIIFATVFQLWKDGNETDVSVVAEELKKNGQLEAVGGFAFLTQVSSRIPTTAQAGYFIETVRRLSLQREFIRQATGAVESAYTLTSDVDSFLEVVNNNFKAIADGSATSKVDKLAARQYDSTRKLEKPSAIYTLGGTQIATPGNLTAIYSQAKTGKSGVIGACMAATMTTPTAGHDTLGIVGPNYAKHAVLHFDTEQSPYDWQQLINASLRRVDLATPPDWLLSYNFTGQSARDNVLMIELAIRLAQKRFKGIHSIIIDGIADLVTDPNDADECFPLITRLHAIAIEHNTAIISVLHMNPGAETKGRGHLGSQLERKCESNITLEKDGSEVTKIFSVKQRGKPIKKDEAPSFRWSDDKMMHVSCDTPPPQSKSPGGRPESYDFATYKNVMPAKSEAGLPLNQLATRLSVNKPITAKQLFNVVQRWIDAGNVEMIDVQGQPKRYRSNL